jgi:hypothetical protein
LASVERRDVGLFDFVPHDHHESHDLAMDHSDGRVFYSLRSPRAEGVFVSRRDRLEPTMSRNGCRRTGTLIGLAEPRSRARQLIWERFEVIGEQS